MPKQILWLSETDKEDVQVVGGKAANLGELVRASIPVPDGFTITSSAYFDFLEANDLKLKIKKLLQKVDPDNTRLLNEASSLIKDLISKSQISSNLAEEISENYDKLAAASPELVAVRSSATAEDLPQASFAGQQATFLNVKGERELLEAVKNCWASLYEPRAIFYRAEKKFDHFKVGIAVVVQKMIESETSGVMFTIDPVNNDKTKIVVEAVWGLGEFIVQGTVNPDHYEIDKSTFKISNRQIAKQTKQLIKAGEHNKEIVVAKAYQQAQKLADEKIVALAKLGKKIENHYGFPQDIEWAYENGILNIVQTRAVTTIGDIEKSLKTHITIDLPIILEGAPASPGIAVGLPKVLSSAKEIHRLKRGEVLVAAMTNPDYVPAMKKAAAVVTDKGGRTSHAAIVSRELGIPCVVGTNKATRLLKNARSTITVNGAAGKVYKGALSQNHLAAIEYVEKKKEGQVRSLKTATKVFVNLGEPDLASEVAARAVDGIGLLRAEFMMAEIGVHPQKIIADGRQKVFIQKLADGLQIFTSEFDPRPVIYRATDFKTNEYRNLKGGARFEEDEANPLLGFRGAMRYIDNPAVFEMELEAIKTVRNKFGFKNIWLMIPFVRTVPEMEQVKKLVAAAGLHRSPSFKLLMMAEIPSNVIQIDEFLDIGIDGVSIGSNDLTMLLLGLDRDNSKISSGFNELDPAVLSSMEKIIAACKKRKLYSGICGQAPSVYPKLTERLVEWGISSVSVSPDVIEKTRQIVYDAEQKLVQSRRA
ncbi:MAG: phosphoenolpyruvate synthase [bacterium]|nr:phosphoenolpyruvate synthase [bacterium]